MTSAASVLLQCQPGTLHLRTSACAYAALLPSLLAQHCVLSTVRMSVLQMQMVPACPGGRLCMWAGAMHVPLPFKLLQEAERYFEELQGQAQGAPDMLPNTVTYAALISGGRPKVAAWPARECAGPHPTAARCFSRPCISHPESRPWSAASLLQPTRRAASWARPWRRSSSR